MKRYWNAGHFVHRIKLWSGPRHPDDTLPLRWRAGSFCLSQLVVLAPWVLQLDDPTATLLWMPRLSSHG